LAENARDVFARTDARIIEAADRRRQTERKQPDRRIDRAIARLQLENRVVEKEIGLEAADGLVALEDDIDH
jgi:hypothetical protein